MIGWVLGPVVVLVILYVGIMKIHNKKDKSKLEQAIAYILLPFGYVLDVIVNIFHATVLFLDFPQELLLTDRIQRYVYHAKYHNTRRERIAKKIARFLNKHDPGHV